MLERMQENTSVTVKIDPSIHSAMKSLARNKRVHIALLYEQAAELFLNEQNKAKLSSKKGNVPAASSR